jgi:hypothetical protein
MRVNFCEIAKGTRAPSASKNIASQPCQSQS